MPAMASYEICIGYPLQCRCIRVISRWELETLFAHFGLTGMEWREKSQRLGFNTILLVFSVIH